MFVQMWSSSLFFRGLPLREENLLLEQMPDGYCRMVHNYHLKKQKYWVKALSDVIIGKFIFFYLLDECCNFSCVIPMPTKKYGVI